MAKKKVTEGCPPQVLALVEHLKATGTGQEKLDQLVAWGCECQADGSGAEGFLARAKSLTPGTVAKIAAYMESHKTTQASPEAVAEHIKENLAGIKAGKEEASNESVEASKEESKKAKK